VTDAIVATVEPAQSHALAPIVPEDKKKLLRETIAKGTSPGEFDLFVSVCNLRRLNPFTKQIHPVVREEWNPNTRQREPKMVIQTGIDGFRVIAERTREFEGEGDYQWCGDDMVWRDVWLESTPPAAARATVYRKGRRPTTMIARWGAYAPYKRDGELMSMWKQRGPEQLVKCASALAFRAAFPEDTSGLYSDDEMAQADNSRPQLPASTKQPERKSEPPPAAAKAPAAMFAQTFPNKNYADTVLAACEDVEVLKGLQSLAREPARRQPQGQEGEGCARRARRRVRETHRRGSREGSAAGRCHRRRLTKGHRRARERSRWRVRHERKLGSGARRPRGRRHAQR
jgi:phage recombination protein Bet